MSDILEVIKTRSRLSQEEAELHFSLVQRYSAEVILESFGPKSFKVFDERGRSVSIVKGTVREGFIHSSNPGTDIVVFATGTPPVMIGWTYSDCLKDTEDRCLVNVKSLYAMPSSFDFAMPCPHLDQFGGYYDDEDECWVCFGCGKHIIAHKIS